MMASSLLRALVNLPVRDSIVPTFKYYLLDSHSFELELDSANIDSHG